MRKILLVCVNLLLLNRVHGGLNGNCELEGVTINQWTTRYLNEARDDNVIEFKTFVARNIASVTVSGEEYGTYINAELKDGNLRIFAKPEFENFEKNEISRLRFEMNVDLNFVCEDGKTDTLYFYQPITDLNTFPPEFSTAAYFYDLPMPLPGGINLACLGPTIEACDYDITNMRLIFELEPAEDFSLEWEGEIEGTKGKCHRASIKTNGRLRLTEDKTYQLVVRDVGQPEKRNTAVLQINVNKEEAIPANPHFEQAYYTATYNTDNEEQHDINVVGRIQLLNGYSGIEPSVLEYEEYFDVSLGTDEIKIKLNKNLPKDILEENSVVLVTIVADLDKADAPGRTVLVVQLPPQKCPEITTPSPPTACPTTEIPTECPVCPETTTPLSCPPCTTESPPTTTNCPPCTTIAPGESSPPTECPVTECSTTPFTSCPPCTTECPPTTTNCPPCTTSDPGESSPPTDCPITECPTTTSECPVCSTTPTDCPSTPPECPSTSNPGESSSPMTECPPCSTTPMDCPVTPPECPSTSEPGVTCPPPTECPTVCPPTESSPPDITTCPPCVTTPEPPLLPTIKFEDHNYWLDAKYEYIGFIGYVRAISNTGDAIKYSLRTIDGSPIPDGLKYNENTGSMKIEQTVGLGQYSLIATAEGVTSQVRDETSVVLNVCDNCGELKTENSILVHQVLENSEGIIDLCEFEGHVCEYEIIHQYPSQPEDLFAIENGILSYPKLNRQMDEIKDMRVPQFLVSLLLKRSTGTGTDKSYNSSHLVTKRSRAYADGDRQWVYLPENVPNSPKQLLMAIIVEDVNDNDPIFDEGNKLVVGYPIANLAAQIAPPYLTKVHATDLDEGNYAEIKYSTESDYFTIHPKTGVIYPNENAFEDESNLKFMVYATDMDGDEAGNRAELEIEVKPLEEDYLTILMVKNLMLEDVDDKLKDLSAKTGIQLKYLTAAVVPSTASTKQSVFNIMAVASFLNIEPIADADHTTKIVVYGLNDDEEPIKTENLQEKLEEEGGIEGGMIEKWSPPSDGDGDCDCEEYDCQEESTAGYIAAVSVLASLLVIFIIAAAAFYYFRIYKRGSDPYSTMDEEDAGSINFEKSPKIDPIIDAEDTPKRRPTGFVFSPPPAEEEDEDEFGEKPKYENPVDFYTNMDTEQTNGIYNTPVDYSTIHSQNSKKVYEETGSGEKVKPEDSPPEFRDKSKSVSFKPTVEKINIVIEDEKQDDILDERL